MIQQSIDCIIVKGFKIAAQALGVTRSFSLFPRVGASLALVVVTVLLVMAFSRGMATTKAAVRLQAWPQGQNVAQMTSRFDHRWMYSPSNTR
jgi:hypothetical protein